MRKKCYDNILCTACSLINCENNLASISNIIQTSFYSDVTLAKAALVLYFFRYYFRSCIIGIINCVSCFSGMKEWSDVSLGWLTMDSYWCGGECSEFIILVHLTRFPRPLSLVPQWDFLFRPDTSSSSNWLRFEEIRERELLNVVVSSEAIFILLFVFLLLSFNSISVYIEWMTKAASSFCPHNDSPITSHWLEHPLYIGHTPRTNVLVIYCVFSPVFTFFFFGTRLLL